MNAGRKMCFFLRSPSTRNEEYEKMFSNLLQEATDKVLLCIFSHPVLLVRVLTDKAFAIFPLNQHWKMHRNGFELFDLDITFTHSKRQAASSSSE